MVSFKINSKTVTFDGDGTTPLLWVTVAELANAALAPCT